MRTFNFSAGPGMMPASVLAQAQRELTDWNGRGFSVLEMPFTGNEFKRIMQRAQDNLRQLLAVPDNYRILFLHGGATAQFSFVPLNLLGAATGADYLESGYWSQRAINAAQRYCTVNIAGSSRTSGFSRLPQQQDLRLHRAAAYCHFTSNETANGVQFHFLPDSGAVPLVADMTSDFLTRPVDIGKFGLIYAGSQKNIGPAGFTVVIVREDLLGSAHDATPAIFDYALQSRANSLLNTPATFAIYLADLVFQWIAAMGGLTVMAHRSQLRSSGLYRVIDDSKGFYRCTVASPYRSHINICFILADERLIPEFFAAAANHGLINLKGHPAVGGVRVSLYNAMPDKGVQELLAFMHAFALEHAAYV